ncbi:hypothetical protein OSTOST_01749 [Ostertagia ostertagi]
MNTSSLLLILCVAVVAVCGIIREKRQQRTVIQRTVINQGFNRPPPYGGNAFQPPYGGNAFGRSPWTNTGFGNAWGTGFNRAPFAPPQPTVVRTTVIRQG